MEEKKRPYPGTNHGQMLLVCTLHQCGSAAFANDAKPVSPRNTHCHNRRHSTMQHTGNTTYEPRKEWGTDASTAAETLHSVATIDVSKPNQLVTIPTGIRTPVTDRFVIIHRLLFSSDIYVTVH